MKSGIPLAMEDYRRIYETIHGVISAAGGRPHRACTLFALAGTILLEEEYGQPATFAAGVAGFNLDGPRPLCFGRASPQGVVADVRGYHAWVVVDDYAIDFMAPLFPDIFRELGVTAPPPRRSFQMPVRSMERDVRGLEQRQGSFALFSDIEVARAVLDDFDADPLHSELLDACLAWFVRPPHAMDPKLVALSNGRELRLEIKAPEIEADFQALTILH